MRLLEWWMAGVLTAPLLGQVAVPLQGAAMPGRTVGGELDAALRGEWVGVLEYRDYSEPVGSTKRVALPTWLTITPAGAGETWHYVYHDGPGKTVEETALVRFDAAHAGYSIAENGKPAQTFTVQGYDTLKAGRGTLVLRGAGVDAGKPADLRVTLTVRRNLLAVLEQARAAGSPEAFAFRHVYTLVRKDAPGVSTK